MPELPEVETIRLGLQKTIVGKKIVKFESRDLKVVQFKPEEVEGYFIDSIERRAKILIFNLSQKYSSSEAKPNREASERSSRLRSNNKSLLCHLKMTGQLIWEECPGEKEHCLKKSRVAGGHPSPDWVAKLPNSYTRAIFHFDDESVLFFNDLRRFGYLKLYQGIQALDPRVKPEDDKLRILIPELSKLGPEPFSNEFTVEYLIKRASKIPNRKIKQFITDQEIIAGV